MKTIKMTFTRRDKQIATWNTLYDKPVEDIINSIKSRKRISKGNIERISVMDLETNTITDLDVNKYKYLLK